MKIRWFEALVLALTLLTALLFLLNDLATVRSGDVTVTVWQGGPCTEEEAISKGVERRETGESTLGKVDLNKADLETLRTLPGVGKEKAQAIIDYRLRRGGFTSIEELLEVDGFGEELLEQIRDRITVS